MRNFIAGMRTQYKAFDEERLLGEVRESLKGVSATEDIIRAVRGTSFYFTIPIVASWTAAKADNEDTGLVFRVTRVQARNKEREADPVEKEILQKMSSSNLKEHWTVDRKINALRYLRAITLSRDCLLCHGTEKDYPPGKGLDPLGMKMEGWSAGEQHGAL